jgi:hypothetical protein
MDSIKPLSPQAFIGSATSQGRGGNQNLQLPATGLTFKALVAEAQADGRFVLEIGDSRLAASSTAALSVGQTLHLQVVKTEPHIELKIIDDSQLSPLAGRSLTLLGKSVDLSPLFQVPRQDSILDTLPPINRDLLESFYDLQRTSPDSKDAGMILKQLTESLGLNLEQLLARGDKQGAAHTLKAALLELVHQSSGNDKITEGAAGKLIDTLELYQLAQLQLRAENYTIYPLPLPFVEQGYLLVEQDGQGTESGGKDAAEQRFSLHLTMSHLGNLHIDFLSNAEGLFIRFMADSQTKADFIAAFGDELRASMADTALVGLAFSGGAGDPTGDLIRRLVPAGRSMLDMKV